MALPNYGLMTTMANGIKEGLIGYQTIKEAQRSQRMQDMQMKREGMTEGENGEINYTPEKQAQIDNENKYKGLLAQTQIGELDPNSEASQQYRASIKGAGINLPETASVHTGQQVLPAYEKKMGLDTSTNLAKSRIDLSGNRLDEMVHERATNSVTKDPQLVQLLNGYQNLHNAKENFLKGGATPQEFGELQQAVRNNIGLKSGGGVSERQETYLRSLGIDKDKFMQFVSGDPQSVLDSDPKMAHQILGLVDLEQKNKQDQAAQQLDKLTKKHEGFYKSKGREVYANDFNNLVGGYKSQFGLNNQGSQKSGLINAAPSGEGGGLTREQKIQKLKQLQSGQ